MKRNNEDGVVLSYAWDISLWCGT